MPRQEYGIQVSNARFKFVELVNTANGIYMGFPIPEMGMHLTLHYPNEEHPNFGAFLRVPSIRRSYTLELDEDVLTLNNLLKMIDSFSTFVDSGCLHRLDDSEILVLPESMIKGFTASGRRNYFDLSVLLSPDWQITETDRLPEMVTKDSPTVVGISLERENTLISSFGNRCFWDNQAVLSSEPDPRLNI
ncbi:MAG: hypothetical protein ACTSQY_03105 [Candidatus Odinarchaeia archaeon]